LAGISTYLNKIMSAVYGEEVRSAIHDAIAAMNAESSSAMQYAQTAKDSAAASASAAKTSETNAANIARQVANNTSAAETAATNAANSASLASQRASETVANAAKAADSAATATQKASAAASSANAAANSAASAKQYSGKPPKPQNGTWWIWDAEKADYVDSKIGCELVGPAGVGIKEIQLTSGNHAPGSTDVYTLTLTDNTTQVISVYNGRNGTGTGDVLGINFDLVIPVSAWVNGKATIADGRLLASDVHKYFLSVDESSREMFLQCDVQPADITTNGQITFTNQSNPTADLTVNLIRLELGANMS